jgi:hypothetical protein
MLKKILIGLGGLVVVLVALGFVLPDRAHVERSIVIKAPREAIYPLIADLNEFHKWSPFADYDPAMTVEVTGSGVGQTMVWKSRKTGDGSEVITALVPPERVDSKLDFGDMGRATASFVLEPAEGGATNVKWLFDARARDGVPVWMAPVATYMGFMMDGMLGKDFERGLAKLKTLAEAA